MPEPLWSELALADLDAIWKYYTEVAGPHTAEKIVRSIDTAVQLLAAHPEGGRSRDGIRPGLRSLAVDPSVLFYRIVKAQVVIIRVLDGRRDIDSIFVDDSD